MYFGDTLIGFQSRGCEDRVNYRHLVPRSLIGVPTVQVNIKKRIDDVQCYQTVRELR